MLLSTSHWRSGLKLREKPVPEHYRKMLFTLAGQNTAASFRFFESEELLVHMSRSLTGELPDGKPDLRWHISISVKGQQRLPSWEEMKEVRAALKPEVFFVIGMPPERYWLNIGEVLHLTETKDQNQIEQWKFEGKRAKEEAKEGIGYGSTIEDLYRRRR